MRVERVIPGESLRRLHADGDRPADQPLLTYYFFVGEHVSAGRYFCTFCGHEANVPYDQQLSLCPNCDGHEYVTLVDG